MMLTGGEERALWAASAARALGRLIVKSKAPSGPHSDALRESAVTHAASYADMIVLEYRKRDGSRP